MMDCSPFEADALLLRDCAGAVEEKNKQQAKITKDRFNDYRTPFSELVDDYRLLRINKLSEKEGRRANSQAQRPLYCGEWS